jgi:hypothetical protein
MKENHGAALFYAILLFSSVFFKTVLPTATDRPGTC